MTLGFKQYEIVENDGPVGSAFVATCNCAEAESFKVYWVEGHNHFHIECVDCGTTYCPFNLCQLPEKTKQDQANPVHEHEGWWYFWDETGFAKHGPYPNEYTAHTEHRRYLHWRGTGEDFPTQ